MTLSRWLLVFGLIVGFGFLGLVVLLGLRLFGVFRIRVGLVVLRCLGFFSLDQGKLGLKNRLDRTIVRVTGISLFGQ